MGGEYLPWLDQNGKRLAQAEIRRRGRATARWPPPSIGGPPPRARHAKSKARVSNYEDLLNEERTRRRRRPIVIPPGPRLGDLVVEAKAVKGFGDRLLFEELSFNLPRGGIVGIIGPNGAGESTLFRMSVGQEQPDGGSLRIGERWSSPMSTRAAIARPQQRLEESRAVWSRSRSASVH